jgi:hypothetical protein
MKPGAANKDAPHIVRFAKNEFANKRWMAVSNNIRCERSSGNYVPLKADFPAKGLFAMTVRGLKFPGDAQNKECILVFQIRKVITSPFDFRELEVVREEIEVRDIDNVTISTQEHTTTNIMTNNKPSSALSSATILDEIGEIDESVLGMEIEYSHIHKENESGTEGIVVHHAQNDPVDMSALSPDSSGDDETRHGSTERGTEQEREKERQSFGLEDFSEMVQALKKREEISGLELYGPFSMPLLHSEEKNYSLREVYDHDYKQRRKYCYATFTYGQYQVCLIEIDQSRLPQGCATYVLKSIAENPFTRSLAEGIVLKPFISYEKIDIIKNKAMVKGIAFISKKHPYGKDEDYYRRWAMDLLQLVAHNTGFQIKC